MEKIVKNKYRNLKVTKMENFESKNQSRAVVWNRLLFLKELYKWL